VDNDALDSVDHFKDAVITILQRLRGLALATIENGVGGRHPRRRGRILASHDADKDVDRGPGVTPRQRTDFSEGLRHLRFAVARRSMFTWRSIGVIHGEIVHHR